MIHISWEKISAHSKFKHTKFHYKYFHLKDASYEDAVHFVSVFLFELCFQRKQIIEVSIPSAVMHEDRKETICFLHSQGCYSSNSTFSNKYFTFLLFIRYNRQDEALANS
jgi:hypothetical protein